MVSLKRFRVLGWWVLFYCLLASAGVALEDSSKDVVLDYKLDYKTTKKQAYLIGWEEFNPPENRPSRYYKSGTFNGQIAKVIIFPGGAPGDGDRYVYNQDPNVMTALPDGAGFSVMPAYMSRGGALTAKNDLEEYKTWAQNIPVHNSVYPYTELAYPLDAPPYHYIEDDPGITQALDSRLTYYTNGWIEKPFSPGYQYYINSDFSFNFSEPDTEEDAENRSEEVEIHPNPPPEPAPQPSLDDLAMVGASFREARTDRSYTRYASQFNLKLKLCEGDYILKWRVEGEHKDDAGDPESFPQERNITIDENTTLDEDGYYDLDWIDIAQDLTPDYVYRLATYKEGATQTFYIEPKDECGCADVGSGGVGFGSVKAWFNLGKDLSDKSAGFIKLYSENIESDTHLPSALTVVRGDSATARFEYDENGALRQAISDRRIIDIVPLADPAEGYQLNYYNASDATGWTDGRFRTFDPSATPYAVWTIKRLADSGGFKRLEITRTEGGTDFVHVYGQNLTTPTTWSFSEANGLKITTRDETPAPNGDIYRTTTLSDGVYGIASVRRERVHSYAWGDEIVEETLDPAGANPLTTTYAHYTSGVGQGQLWKTTTADGTVTENTYQSFDTGLGVITSRIAGTTTTYLNGRSRTTSHATLADLTGNPADEAHSLVTTTESFGGQVIRRSWQIGYSNAVDLDGDGVLYTSSHSIRAAASSAAWDDPRNEVTISRAADSTTGRINLTLSPDGKITRTHRGLPDGEGIRVITTETGPANVNGTGVLADSGGTRTEAKIDASGRTVQQTTTDIATGLMTALELVTDWNADNPELPATISFLDGGEEVRAYSTCCGKLESVTRNGRTTTYTYDDLGRQKTVTQDGITTETRYDAADRVRENKIHPEGSPGAAKLVSGSTFDPAGRLTANTTPYAIGQTVSTTQAETVNATTGETTTVTTYPSDTDLAAGVVTEVRAADGSPLRTTGNATSPVSYAYSTATLADAADWGFATSDRFFVTVATKLDASGAATAETVTTYQDAFGRILKTVYPDDAAARHFYDSAGRLTKAVDPDGVTTLYGYASGGFGEKTTVAIDLAAITGGTRNGTIDLASGHDRVTETTVSIASRDGVTVRRTRTEVWEEGAEAKEVGLSDVSVDHLRSWKTGRETQTTASIVTIGAGGTRTETTTHPDDTQIIRTLTAGRLASEIRKDANGDVVLSVSYQYDDYGRTEGVTQAGVGTTSYTYFDSGLVETIATPDPGTGAQTTTHAYNKRGWSKAVTYPDDATKETSYYPNGRVKREWGARTYPVDYTYDAQGRMKTMTTWQDFAGETRAAVTTWNYHLERGWLDNKRYQDNKGPNYTYTPAGRLETRTWARTVGGSPLITTYGYTDAGEVESIGYSDTTPGVVHDYDRAGRLRTTTDAAGILTRSYDDASFQLSDEVYSGTGLLSGRSIVRTYDSRHRPQSLATDSGYALHYGYDRAGRLEHVGQGFHQAVYAYKPSQGTIDSVTIKRTGVERVKHTRETDAIGRITQMKSATGAAVHVKRDYAHNDANQRTGIEHEDTRRWAYGYDDLGQVTSAQKRLADDTTPLPGYSFGYAFDTIGNRTTTTVNGRTATYAPDANLLNQYASRTVPGFVDVRGEAHADAEVLVNELEATRTGKEFYREITLDNSASSAKAAVMIDAVKLGPPDLLATETRAAFLPLTPESFVHDHDGNLKEDGRWSYTWDAENRLVVMETLPAVAVVHPALKQRLEFVYDAQGRRIGKTVKLWNVSEGTWATSADYRFLYDGWNLVAELDAQNSNAILRTHVWGSDLSGTMQGAGGVGGLLWSNAGGVTFAAASDANGNVAAWINTATTVVAGRADSGAFGEPVVRTGVANTLPFGFSTKYTDSETGLLYYGYRYLDVSTGRWLSRDPIEEQGGANLYAVVGNNAMNVFDPLGLVTYRETLIHWDELETRSLSIIDAGKFAVDVANFAKNVRTQKWIKAYQSAKKAVNRASEFKGAYDASKWPIRAHNRTSTYQEVDRTCTNEYTVIVGEEDTAVVYAGQNKVPTTLSVTFRTQYYFIWLTPKEWKKVLPQIGADTISTSALQGMMSKHTKPGSSPSRVFEDFLK